ncbi:hypothetical protein GVAV_002488 [Gurleya vavrai]
MISNINCESTSYNILKYIIAPQIKTLCSKKTKYILIISLSYPRCNDFKDIRFQMMHKQIINQKYFSYNIYKTYLKNFLFGISINTAPYSIKLINNKKLFEMDVIGISANCKNKFTYITPVYVFEHLYNSHFYIELLELLKILNLRDLKSSNFFNITFGNPITNLVTFYIFFYDQQIKFIDIDVILRTIIIFNLKKGKWDIIDIIYEAFDTNYNILDYIDSIRNINLLNNLKKSKERQYTIKNLFDLASSNPEVFININLQLLPIINNCEFLKLSKTYSFEKYKILTKFCDIFKCIYNDLFSKIKMYDELKIFKIEFEFDNLFTNCKKIFLIDDFIKKCNRLSIIEFDKIQLIRDLKFSDLKSQNYYITYKINGKLFACCYMYNPITDIIEILTSAFYRYTHSIMPSDSQTKNFPNYYLSIYFMNFRNMTNEKYTYIVNEILKTFIECKRYKIIVLMIVSPNYRLLLTSILYFKIKIQLLKIEISSFFKKQLKNILNTTCIEFFENKKLILMSYLQKKMCIFDHISLENECITDEYDQTLNKINNFFIYVRKKIFSCIRRKELEIYVTQQNFIVLL